MKIWVDDVRPAPNGYLWCKSVNDAKKAIIDLECFEDGQLDEFDFDYWDDYTPSPHILNLDHDAGDYAKYGGDYIKLLNWLEETGRRYPICLHTMNPVGRENMRRIIQKNHWTEVF